MSVLFRGVQRPVHPQQRFPSRSNRVVVGVNVNAHSALRHSAVWASLRLRADLISSMPVDVFRKVGDVDVEVDKPSVLVSPGGSDMSIDEWMWASQFDLDRVGNSFGLVLERDGADKPAVIELQDHTTVVVKVNKDGVVSYRIRNVDYAAKDVWHERQYRIAGMPMGLSPISFAAMSIGQYLSAQQFGIDWFNNGGTIPSGHLRNTSKTLDDDKADRVKDRFKLAVADRDVFVTGQDWEYSTISVAANEGQFIESQKYSSSDIGRFIGVPGDLIDLAAQGSSITYANISQRNLQFLIMNLWAAVRRRQTSLSKLVDDPRFVRLKTDALLQMDPATLSLMLGQQIDDRMIAPSEARALINRQPFTPDQLAEFDQLFQKKGTGTSKPVAPAA